jgi:probable HAF family extracellular repeat protein
MEDLGSLPHNDNSLAYGVNHMCHVVGESVLSGRQNNHAFLWTRCDGMRDLGTLPGGRVSSATGINRRDVVVGSSDFANSGGTSHAFVWTNQTGMQDLNSLIPPQSGWLLTKATALNRRGQITGYGTIGGQTHAFLLTPTLPIC